MTRARHLIITGGSGYIGARLVRRAIAEGREVTLLGRRAGLQGTRHVPWELGDPLPYDALAARDVSEEVALIHLAHDWQAGQSRNVDGTQKLFDSARDAGVESRIFISSQSARQEALNLYGRMKWTTEQCIAGATSLRVGLVYGGAKVAMYGVLCRLASLPFLPMIEPNRTVQPIHIDDVARGILAAADGRARGVLALAGPKQIRFGDVLRALARAYGGHRLLIIPVPLRLALFACALTRWLPIVPTIDRERVLGLAGTEPIESALDLARLGISVQPLASQLAQEPAGRRATLQEGQVFLRHAGIEPSSALLRRYARAVPEGAILRPTFALRWCEPLGARGLLGKRLRIAARIAEASASGETLLARGTRAGRLIRLVFEGFIEVALLPTRLIASVVWR